ncbi:MAG TPA: transposase [Pirellulales bacterium]|nr:transposase [Pirellulales bacterium]
MTVASPFNLPPPASFRGLHPDLPLTVYYRHLPHWRQEGATYFVTFRLADALPQEKLHFLKRLRDEWERTHPPPRSEADWKDYAREVTNSAERWLDEGYGACHFREQRWCDDLRERLHHFQGQRYFLSCWAIMPNHCHAVIQPFKEYSLEDLLGAMKGVTARHINVALATSGSLWEEECYDRIVRDEQHLWRVIQYIGRNLRLAGLAHEVAWRRWIHPDWEAAGWGFRDDP